jgi:hypothetical protein
VNPAEIVLKILQAIFTLGAKAMEDAARGDAEALAALEADHVALEQFLAASAARRKAWRAANDARLEQLARDQAAVGAELLPLPDDEAERGDPTLVP